ncbi:MAG TPA: hypothetical protein VGY30_02415 [Solirubrobacteraceae bacterium]|jgi:hypothetical protein|nr:hypothetical protein [Solirubrobacteraceae bacterium]
MRLFVVWSAEESGPPLPIRAGDLALCFDPLALDRARAGGASLVLDADSLLDWEARARIDEQAAALADRLALDPGLANVRVAGESLIEFAHYDLLIELNNLLRGFELGAALTEEHRIDALAAQSNAPSSLRLGVGAAIEAHKGAAGATSACDPWIPISFSGPYNRTHALVAQVALATTRALRRRHPIRVLAIPAGKVPAALERLDRAELSDAGVGLANFPGLSQGGAARLALSSGLPTVPAGGLRIAHESPGARSRAWPIPTLIEPPALQAALAALVRTVLTRSSGATARVSNALRVWGSLPDLRALLLPYAMVGPARLATRWAHSRGVAVAVIQHGMYGLRSGPGPDVLADQIFGWGPGVVEQLRAFPQGHPRVCSVGVPDLLPSPRRDPPTSIGRVLVTTTNRPLGSAIGAYGLPEQFIEDLVPGLRQLVDAGARVELRLHPAESRSRYEALLATHGLELPFSSDGPLAELLSSCDLVVSAVSSAVFEAAALGLPVLLWAGRMPRQMRERCLLPPLCEELPAQFLDAEQFLELARRAIQEPSAVIVEGRALADRLCHFAQPLDTARLAAELMRLGSDATLPA